MPDLPQPRRSGPRIAAIIIMIVAAIAGSVVGVGAIRTPAGQAQGTTLNGAALAPATRPSILRVASFNIHSCMSESGRLNPDLTAQTLQGFDLAGLMEVRGSLTSTPQAQLLGDMLHQPWLFAPTERRFWHDDFGNAVLTHLPVTSWERLPLPSIGESGSRNLLIARLAEPAITVLITHIARHNDQDLQLKTIAEVFLRQTTPVILMGDLNATSDNPVLKDLLANPTVGNPLDQFMPELRGKHIDWILTRGLTLRDAGTRELGASDHPLIWAELQIPSSTTRP